MLLGFVISLFCFTGLSQAGIKGSGILGALLDESDNSFRPGFQVGLVYYFNDDFRTELTFESIFHREIDNGNTYSYNVMPISICLDYVFRDYRKSVRPYLGLGLTYINFSTKFLEEITRKSRPGFFPKAGVKVKITDQLFCNLGAKLNFYIDIKSKNDLELNKFPIAELSLIYLFDNLKPKF